MSKRKCEDCGERVDICRELGGCQPHEHVFAKDQAINVHRAHEAHVFCTVCGYTIPRRLAGAVEVSP